MSKKQQYSIYQTFVYRVPSLPLEVLKTIPDNSVDMDSFITRTWESKGLVFSSIGIASGELARALSKKEGASRSPIDPKVRLSFLNYLTRMITRSTPFGIMAGVGSGQIVTGNQTAIQLKPAEESVLLCRPDMGFLLHEMEQLQQNDTMHPTRKFGASDSLYLVGDQLRYIAPRDSHAGKRSYQLESAESNEVLLDLLKFAIKPRKFEDLVRHLIAMGYERTESEEYLDQLIRGGIFVAQPQPCLTHIMYSHQVLGLLESDTMDDAARRVVDIINGAAAIRQVSDLTGIKTPGQYQVDMLRTAKKSQIAKSLAMQVLNGIRLVRSLGQESRQDGLAEFKKSFIRRFGDRDVPLLLVFDQDYGTGLNGPSAQQQAVPSDLLDNLMAFQSRGKSSPSNQPKFRPEERWSTDYPDYYELTDDDIKLVDFSKKEWPDQLFALFSLSGKDDQTDIHFHLVSDGHPAGLLNRFGFLPDKDLHELLRQILTDEAATHPDNIYAEIVHLPEGRTGNILQRREGHEYEIVLMAGSTRSEEKIIKPADILVRVEWDRVRLIHSKTQKTIVPILNNAHNFESDQLPVYEFLVHVGKQYGGSSYHLRNLQGGKHGKVPGIKAGNLILRPLRWYLQNPFKKQTEKTNKQISDISKWATQKGLPPKVQLIHADRHLYIDWQNPLLVESFLDFIRGQDLLIFEPFIYLNGSPVKGEDGSYANELLICFRKE